MYDLRGQVETLTSYDNATVGSGNVVNQVVCEYDEHGLLVKEYQEHDGAKDANTPYVGYNYDTTASSGVLTKGLRLTSLRYPNGRLVHYTYGSSGSTADALGRIAAINDDDSGSPGDALAEYGHLGSGSIVQVDYPEPDIRYDLAYGAGDDPYDGPLDRFARVSNLLWRDYGSSTDVVRIQHGYDRAGNRLWREDPVAASYSKDFDELYAYDGMYQLVDMQRGDLNGTKDGLVANSKTFAEDWSLDMTGNWSTYRQDEDGDGNWDLNQSRTHNGANEITQIAGVSIHVAHDRNGNMTKIPKPDDWSDHFDVTYDAWNRLVAVVDGETVIGEYHYDGSGRRIRRDYDSGAPGSSTGVDIYVHYFYNDNWQVLESRETDNNTGQPESIEPQYQFAWNPRYVDSPILRDENTDHDGICDDERIYYLADANFNVTALADDGGDVVERYIYDAYGGVAIYDASWLNARGTSSYDNAVLYTGREHDGETGLCHYRKRCYCAEIGRFMSRDPLPNSDADHAYAYVRNQPLTRLDPTGAIAIDFNQDDVTYCKDMLTKVAKFPGVHDVLPCVRIIAADIPWDRPETGGRPCLS